MLYIGQKEFCNFKWVRPLSELISLSEICMYVGVYLCVCVDIVPSLEKLICCLASEGRGKGKSLPCELVENSDVNYFT